MPSVNKKTLVQLNVTPGSSQGGDSQLDALRDKALLPEFLTTDVSRRRWMQVMGASMAFSSVVGCRWEQEEIAPYSERPEGRVPGKPVQYATAFDVGRYAQSLLVSCYDGRPIKVEGNKDQVDSLGASGMFAQASVLSLYDPDRSRHIRQAGSSAVKELEGGKPQIEVHSEQWEVFEDDFSATYSALAANGGEGFAVLAQPSASPSYHRLKEEFKKKYPKAVWSEYAPLESDSAKEASLATFGEEVRPLFDLTNAKIILDLEADILGKHSGSIANNKQFAQHRDPDLALDEERGWMSRLYCVESQYSETGTVADSRLALRSSEIGNFLRQVIKAINDLKAGKKLASPKENYVDQFVVAVATDLWAHQGETVVAVGSGQPAEVQTLAHYLNANNAGKTVNYIRQEGSTEGDLSLAELVSEINSGNVKNLVVLGGNPVYDAPVDLKFSEALSKVGQVVRLGHYYDETSRASHWHLPLKHSFEAWGDGRTYSGQYLIAQPLLKPLVDNVFASEESAKHGPGHSTGFIAGKSVLEFLSYLLGVKNGTEESIVRKTLSQAIGSQYNEKTWLQSVHDGFVEGAKTPYSSVSVKKAPDQATSNTAPEINTKVDSGDLEVVFSESEALYDGRFSNNGWLQETPARLTKMTWDNAGLISVKTAKQLGVDHGDIVKLNYNGRELETPLFIVGGQADGSIGLTLGYGRTGAGPTGGDSYLGIESVGVDVYQLRDSSPMNFGKGLKVQPTGQNYTFACTQDPLLIDAKGFNERARRVGELIRFTTLEQYKEHRDFTAHAIHLPGGVDEDEQKLLWERPEYNGQYSWGMSIDLSKCTGCNACVVACQAENNISVVGRDQVLRGREMHWQRIDCYPVTTAEDAQNDDYSRTRYAIQPVACMHCENAPCEQVCPVAATTHSEEGLNDMAYNRCIGTRYCGNNCPFKVRRFNFLSYAEERNIVEPVGKYDSVNRELSALVMNPDVTVRSRGVMEKCTYCVQRIQGAKIESRREGRSIYDGEIKVACQQVCASDAIEFGDLNDENSKVRLAHEKERAYGMLAELNVAARTKYLSKIYNPHPTLAQEVGTKIHSSHGSHDDHHEDSNHASSEKNGNHKDSHNHDH
ncbi:MAG: 4Fe-4S dicluster domain-containing protein [Pirellulaceae bacterium]|nr:4Fe-4S dicluster domain-containing protein [Pirellulaceae bacterium]